MIYRIIIRLIKQTWAYQCYFFRIYNMVQLSIEQNDTDEMWYKKKSGGWNYNKNY